MPLKKIKTMISNKRMQTDLAGQAVLLAGAATVGLGGLPWAWLALQLALLSLWQLGSALQLALEHEYQQRQPFIWALAALALGIPLGYWLLGPSALAPAAALPLLYFWATIRDVVKVWRRPRSFWDL
jgi:hypothetical protein